MSRARAAGTAGSRRSPRGTTRSKTTACSQRNKDPKATTVARKTVTPRPAAVNKAAPPRKRRAEPKTNTERSPTPAPWDSWQESLTPPQQPLPYQEEPMPKVTASVCRAMRAIEHKLIPRLNKVKDPWWWDAQELCQHLSSIDVYFGSRSTARYVGPQTLAEKVRRRGFDGALLMMADDVHDPRYGICYMLDIPNDGSGTVLQFIIGLLRMRSPEYQRMNVTVDQMAKHRWEHGKGLVASIEDDVQAEEDRSPQVVHSTPRIRIVLKKR